MATDIGVKIGVEGAAQFKSSLQNVNAELKSLASEMKAATAEFKGNESSTEALEKKQRILKDTMDAAQKKVDLLSEEYRKQTERLDALREAAQKAEEENGKNSEEAEKARAAFEKQETATYKLKDQLNNAKTALYNTANEEKNVGHEAEGAEGKVSRFGEILGASLTSKAITSALGTIASGIKKVGKMAWGAIKETAEYADEVATLATKYSLTTDQVQEFMYMEELVDVSLETFTGSLSKVTRNMDSAREGTGKAAEAFTTLGVSVTDSNGQLRDSYDVFLESIDALGKVENATERDALAMDIFGKSAQDLNPLIAQGSENLEALATEAQNSGAVMSGEALDAANEFKDGMDKAQEKIDAVKREIAEKLMPKLEEMIEKFLEWADGIDWKDVGEKIVEVFENIEAVVGDLASAFEALKGWADKARGSIIAFQDSGAYKVLFGSGDSLWKTLRGSAGRYAEGYYNVPYDNYPAVLHAGEMVLTASEARALRSGGMGGTSVNIYTQQIDNATIDYVINRVNGALGAMA